MESGAVTRPLPTGRVTLLLTDIEGSTSAWDQDPAGTDAQMARHDAYVTATVIAHGGVLLKAKGEGDSTFSVFDDPAAAVAAALDLVRGLPGADVTLPVRVAVHVGDVEPRAGDYFGPVPNRAARLRGLAPGGQVLLSAAAAADVAERLPLDAEIVALGTHQLRGLADPEEVFGLAHPDLAPVEPLVVFRPPTNLPAPVDSFVGRHDERTALEKALGRHRLVTIVGPGGVGKTRLALEVAADHAHALTGGTWFVDAGPMLSPDQLAPAIVAAFGGELEPGADPVERAAAAIKGRALLVLDTCEAHLEIAAELVDALLLASDDLAVLATSRQGLRVRGEAVLRLGPLGLAESDNGPGEAAQLFLARAGAADLRSAADLDLASIERICAALDGVPLALELAAARLGELDLDELGDQLAAVVGLDDGGDVRHSGPARQRTVRATVRWSLDSTPVEERALVTRLAAFTGGWPRGAPEAVCADEQLSAAAVTKAHAGLVGRSLVVAAPDTGAGLRHRLLDAVRTVVADELADECRPVLADRHLAWCVARATALDDAASTGTLPGWVAHFAAEMPNLRTGVARAVEIADAGAAQAIAAATCNAWMEAGAFTEAAQMLDLALGAGGGGATRARALAASALMAMYLGEMAKAREQLAEATKLVRSDGVVPALLRAEVLSVASRMALQDNRRDAAHELCVEALDAARTSGDRHCLSIALNNAAVSQPAFAHAERVRLLTEAADLEAELGNTIFARVHLAAALGLAGRPARGLAMIETLDGVDHDAFTRFSMERVRAILELQVMAPEQSAATARAALAHAATIGLGLDESEELLVVLGRALQCLGRSAEALVELDSVEGDEWRETSVLRSIEVLLDLGELDEAEARLSRVGATDDAVLLAREAALVQLARGRGEEALATLRTVRDDPGRATLGYSELELLEVELQALEALGMRAEAAHAATLLEALRSEAANT